MLLNTEGAPIDVEDWNLQETPLSLALRTRAEPLAIKLIEEGADVNVVDIRRRSPLLHAVSNRCLQACRLLLNKGVDMNLGSDTGQTPLLVACKKNWVEGVCMLLYYGVDATSIVLAANAQLTRIPLEIQDILSDYIFDDYKIPVHLNVLMEAMTSQTAFSDTLLQKVSQILYKKEEFDHLVCKIPRLKSHYLQLFIEQFECALIDLILHDDPLLVFGEFLKRDTNSPEENATAIENLSLLVRSHLCSCMVKSINNDSRNPGYIYTVGDFFKQLPKLSETQIKILMDVVSQLLKQGLRINYYDLGVVYVKYGYCPLFKQMSLLNVGNSYMRKKRKQLLPQLICDVKMTMEEFLVNNDQYDSNYLHLVLDHFSHPQLKEIFLNVSDKFERKVKRLPQVPLLIELARNATRKHLVDFYKIRNFRQLAWVVRMLNMPEKCRKILTFEEKLYP